MEKLKRIDYWYSKPLGEQLKRLEVTYIDALLPRLPGDTLLQIGGPSDGSFVTKSACKQNFFCSLDGSLSHIMPTFCADLEYLPLHDQSLDVAMLLHVLPSVEDPLDVLRQLHHALKPGAKMLIMGFNPWSAWGVQQRWGSQRDFPWGNRFLSLSKLKRWLRTLNLQTLTVDHFCFSLPVQSAGSWHHNAFVEILGRQLFPIFGGVYMLLVEKQRSGMTPLPRKWFWRRSRPSVGGWAGSTNRYLNESQDEKN